MIEVNNTILEIIFKQFLFVSFSLYIAAPESQAAESLQEKEPSAEGVET
jgi:hypothetical protein